MGSDFWKQIAQAALDAADVDLQRFQASLLSRVSSLPTGRRFSQWAEANPLGFEALVRALSVVIHRSSRDLRSRGMLADTLATQLSVLPYHLRQAFLADNSPIPPTPTNAVRNSSLGKGAPASQAPSLARAVSDLTVAEAVEFLESRRADGELLGAVTREFLRVAVPDPAAFAEAIDTFQLPDTPGVLSSASGISRADRTKIAAEMVDTMRDAGVSEGELAAMSDLSDVEAAADSPLMSGQRRQYRGAFNAAMREKAAHTPTVNDLAVVATELRYMLKKAPIGYLPPAQHAELGALFAQVRSTWKSSARPAQWLTLLEVAEQALMTR